MNRLSTVMQVIVISIFTSFPLTAESDVIIENSEMKLILTDEGKAKSLVHKPSGTECLSGGGYEPVQPGPGG